MSRACAKERRESDRQLPASHGRNVVIASGDQPCDQGHGEMCAYRLRVSVHAEALETTSFAKKSLLLECHAQVTAEMPATVMDTQPAVVHRFAARRCCCPVLFSNRTTPHPNCPWRIIVLRSLV